MIGLCLFVLILNLFIHVFLFMFVYLLFPKLTRFSIKFEAID